ncbi:MAG TPA: PqqD family protein [Anaerolineae bacterium]|nr:PqqD family protein [Anaerolineae bacterium]HNU02688.1 PqqD family protein [Anaerolineae bacterium]
MSRFSLDSSFAKDSDQIIERVVAGEALLINLANGDYYSLDGVGTVIWENIDGRRTVDDLANIVTEEYNADKDQVVADVLRLVGQLTDEGLLVAL